MQQSSNKNNNEQRRNMKKLQWLRMSVQLIFLVILIGGLYKFVKPAFVVILPGMSTLSRTVFIRSAV